MTLLTHSSLKLIYNFKRKNKDCPTTDRQEVPPQCDPLHMRDAADGLCVSLKTHRIVGITMNHNVPFIWRVNYRNEVASRETFLEIAHEKARQYLRKNLSSMSVHKAV
jgi:hypothetical protein